MCLCTDTDCNKCSDTNCDEKDPCDNCDPGYKRLKCRDSEYYSALCYKALQQRRGVSMHKSYVVYCKYSAEPNYTRDLVTGQADHTLQKLMGLACNCLQGVVIWTRAQSQSYALWNIFSLEFDVMGLVCDQKR